jgi:flagellar P-ring protein precursor FlgI
LNKVCLFILLIGMMSNCYAARVKDIANIRGVRTNQLVGYGLVVGLKGTGDSKAEYTGKSIARMLSKLGMQTEAAASKNVAAVIVTASLPAFSRSGNQLDVTVSSIGDANSLRGGTLIQTPLRASDQQVYAVAQGPLIVGFNNDDGVHENVGRVSNGAIIEKDLGKEFAQKKMFRLTLHNPDFTTSARLAKTINMALGGKFATALDGGTIDLVTPYSYEGKGVELISIIESLEVNPDFRAKVVVNEKTGTVVIGSHVKISKVAISHGNLSLKVKKEGKDEDEEKKNKKDEKPPRILLLNEGVSVGEIVKALNTLGVTPKDLITILQSVKAAGALQGELKIL